MSSSDKDGAGGGAGGSFGGGSLGGGSLGGGTLGGGSFAGGSLGGGSLGGGHQGGGHQRRGRPQQPGQGGRQGQVQTCLGKEGQPSGDSETMDQIGLDRTVITVTNF